MQVFKLGKANNNIIKLIPRLMVIIILANISFYLVQVLVDLSNILGYGIAQFFSSITEPFDLTTAPFAGGYFLGDYQSLVSSNNVFIPFFVKTNSGDFANRTDVFAAPAIFKPIGKSYVSTSAIMTKSSSLQQRVHNNIQRVKQQRKYLRWGLKKN